MSKAHEKVESVQLLRAVAAGVVAIAHGAFAFADGVGSGLGVPNIGAYPAQIGVALFFIVSGYVMVVSSRNLFGRTGATRTFWTRRAVRILRDANLAARRSAQSLLGSRRGRVQDTLRTTARYRAVQMVREIRLTKPMSTCHSLRVAADAGECFGRGATFIRACTRRQAPTAPLYAG